MLHRIVCLHTLRLLTIVPINATGFIFRIRLCNVLLTYYLFTSHAQEPLKSKPDTPVTAIEPAPNGCAHCTHCGNVRNVASYSHTTLTPASSAHVDSPGASSGPYRGCAQHSAYFAAQAQAVAGPRRLSIVVDSAPRVSSPHDTGLPVPWCPHHDACADNATLQPPTVSSRKRPYEAGLEHGMAPDMHPGSQYPVPGARRASAPGPDHHFSPRYYQTAPSEHGMNSNTTWGNTGCTPDAHGHRLAPTCTHAHSEPGRTPHGHVEQHPGANFEPTTPFFATAIPRTPRGEHYEQYPAHMSNSAPFPAPSGQHATTPRGGGSGAQYFPPQQLGSMRGGPPPPPLTAMMHPNSISNSNPGSHQREYGPLPADFHNMNTSTLDPPLGANAGARTHAESTQLPSTTSGPRSASSPDTDAHVPHITPVLHPGATPEFGPSFSMYAPHSGRPSWAEHWPVIHPKRPQHSREDIGAGGNLNALIEAVSVLEDNKGRHQPESCAHGKASEPCVCALDGFRLPEPATTRVAVPTSVSLRPHP